MYGIHHVPYQSVSAPLGSASFGQIDGNGSSTWQRLLSFPSINYRGLAPRSATRMSRPLVRALRSEATFFNGGLSRRQWSQTILTRKVGVVVPAPRCDPPCAPLSTQTARLRNRNSRAPTLRTPPIANAWDNTRNCSSHASSSLVKMATDRDILSAEYVLLFTFTGVSHLSARNR
jgi:hypothetical protein